MRDPARAARTRPRAASDGALLAAKERFLPAAQSDYANTPDGAQARYDAGRDLVEAVLAAGPVTAERRALRADLLARGRAQVARAEALDRDDGFRSAGAARTAARRLRRHGPRRPDPTLARRLAAAAARVNGAAGIWVHDLSTGRYAGYEADTRFAAASTVKLGALAAALRRSPSPSGAVVVRRAPDRLLVVEPRREPDLGRSRLRRDQRRAAPARHDLEHLSRARIARRPPGARPARTTRVTTARDLGRALYRLHAGAHGDARVLQPARPLPPAGDRRLARARIRAAGRRQRRADPALARRRDHRREERLALRHAHDRGDRLCGRPGDDRRRRALSPRRDARGGEAARTATCWRRGLVASAPTPCAATPSSVCFSSW